MERGPGGTGAARGRGGVQDLSGTRRRAGELHDGVLPLPRAPLEEASLRPDLPSHGTAREGVGRVAPQLHADDGRPDLRRQTQPADPSGTGGHLRRVPEALHDGVQLAQLPRPGASQRHLLRSGRPRDRGQLVQEPPSRPWQLPSLQRRHRRLHELSVERRTADLGQEPPLHLRVRRIPVLRARHPHPALVRRADGQPARQPHARAADAPGTRPRASCSGSSTGWPSSRSSAAIRPSSS